MPDIFISYSRKDSEQAEQLAELLASAGLSCWIDKAGIEAATSWSKEIVQAIDQCSTFVVLLSTASNESTNVHKEVSLASEKKKKILPLDLEPVPLSEDLQYHLAGIQRTPMTNIDAVIRALAKLGLEATAAPQPPKIAKETDGRKSLMILPFEDLSPAGDNQWFADGIVIELIDALSNVKQLRVTDAQTAKAFRNFKGRLATYAKEMSVRYFVQGEVRKFGEQIKISARLLDIATGDQVWQDSLRGTMDDIFEIQELVAKKVVEGLRVILTKDEEDKIAKKPTENAEAYELYLKGNQCFGRHTKNDYERALELFEEATRRDPKFAVAYANIVNTCAEMYRKYSRAPNLLARAETAAAKIREIEGETASYSWVMSLIMLMRRDAEQAFRFAEKSVTSDPAFAPAYEALGRAYKVLGKNDEAVRVREQSVRLNENNKVAHFKLLTTLHDLGDPERLRHASEEALPVYERHLRLSPDDNTARVELAMILLWAGRKEEALRSAEELSTMKGLDGGAVYNLAC
ncbi:MAG: TIR domain-containing protein, partial [Candidatus Kapaibacterium sp.]